MLTESMMLASEEVCRESGQTFCSALLSQ